MTARAAAAAHAEHGIRFTVLRRCVQSAFALLFLAAPFLASPWIGGSAIAAKLGPIDVLEPVSALSGVLAAGALATVAVVGALPLVLATFAWGSVFCAWVCPYGLLSEALDRLARGRHARWPAPRRRSVRKARSALLAATLLLSALLGVPVVAALAPPRLVSALPIEARALGGVPAVTATLLAAVLALEVLARRRLVCRALCPVGAGAALVRTPLTWRPRLVAERCRCPGAAPCLAACNWGLDPRELAWSDGCTACLACVERCPSGALRMRHRTTAPSSSHLEER